VIGFADCVGICVWTSSVIGFADCVGTCVYENDVETSPEIVFADSSEIGCADSSEIFNLRFALEAIDWCLNCLALM
jgi:hypothetical protein